MRKNKHEYLRKEQVYAFLRDWQKSGLSQASFCLREGLPLPVFRDWLRCARREGQARKKVSGFQAIELPEASSPREAVLVFRTGEVLHIPIGQGGIELLGLIRELHRPC